jgi:hypothetical protein
MVPEPGAGRREAFAAEYGDEHEGKDTRDHFGSGMDVHASFEAAAAAREMADAQAAAQAAARRDAEARAKVAAAETAERARLEAASAERELEKARQARAETAAEKARQRATLPLGEPQARREDGERPTTTTRRALSTQPYSAAEASRKGREGSGWFDALGETAVAERARSSASSRAAPPPPWLLGTETDRSSGAGGGARITGRAAAPAARDARPFATADSFATWSSHVASAEARLMALSQERDQLEGELSRMPEGSGRTIEQRRKKANAEKRLDEVLKASSAARHQLKAANRNLGHAAV